MCLTQEMYSELNFLNLVLYTYFPLVDRPSLLKLTAMCTVQSAAVGGGGVSVFICLSTKPVFQCNAGGGNKQLSENRNKDPLIIIIKI
jgi:hypothetical protein